METDISLTRRTLLAGAGAGVALGGGLFGTSLLAPTWLPDPVTDALLTVYPDPPTHIWRPTISDAHADKAVTLLEETVTRANDRRERVDMDSVPENLAVYLNSSDPSGGWLESAQSASSPEKRLSYATQGLQFAGEVLGSAKVALDTADPKALVKRGDHLRTEAGTVLDSFSDYRVADPV